MLKQNLVLNLSYWSVTLATALQNFKHFSAEKCLDKHFFIVRAFCFIFVRFVILRQTFFLVKIGKSKSLQAPQVTKNRS